MTDVYLTDGAELYEKVIRLSRGAANGTDDIKREKNGKPYIAGYPIHFSISHSGGRGVIAVGDRPVGVDIEVFSGKPRDLIISKLSLREREEISDEKTFLKNWTAKESFVKMLGGSIASYFKRLEFYGGKIYLDGQPQNCGLGFIPVTYGVVAICGDADFNARSL